MATGSLEERVLRLEALVEKLRAARTTGRTRKDWRRTVGLSTGDALMREIDKEALNYRVLSAYANLQHVQGRFGPPG